MKTNRHIEIVSSSIKGLSSMSARSRGAIAATLAKHYADVRVTIVDDFSDLEALTARKPDLVFLGMKSLMVDASGETPDPQEVLIADYLRKHGVAHTGSPGIAHQLEADKSLAKQQVRAAGLATAQSVVIRREESLHAATLPLYPVFIKPTNRGGGDGIDERSIAHTFSEAQAKIASIATDLQADSLVESYLPGREFSVAILRSGQDTDDTFWTMPIELVAEPNEQGARMLSGDTKSSNAEVVLAVPKGATRTAVCALALGAFHALQAQDYGRIDIRMDAHGVPQFLEANLIPSLIAGYGSFPKASVLNQHLDFEDMILHITRLGLARSTSDSASMHRRDLGVAAISAPEDDLVPLLAR